MLRIAARRCGLSAILTWNPAAASRSSFCPTSCCWLAHPVMASKPVKAQKAIDFVTAESPRRKNDQLRLWKRRRAPNPTLQLQSVDRAGLANAAQPMMAEKLESLEAADRFGKLGGHQHIATQWLAQGFDACRLIDGRSDYSEIEAIGCADITVQHLSNVQSEIDMRGRLTQAIAFLHCSDGLPCGIERFA